MTRRRLTYLAAFMVAGAIPAAAWVSTPVASADPVDTAVAIYAATNSGPVCSTLDANPSIVGVVGVVKGIEEDGAFTPYEAGEVLAISVVAECPQHTGLLQRFIDAYAGSEVHA